MNATLNVGFTFLIKTLTSMRWLAPISLVATLAVLLLASACSSSDSKVAQDKWVADICTSAKSFTAAQDTATDPLTKLSDTASPADQKKAFQSAMDGFQSATKDFKSSFDKAGTPDLDHASDIKGVFAKEFADNQSRLDTAKKAIDELDVNSKTFSDDITKIGGDDPKGFRGKLQAVSGSQPLIDAIDKDPDCATVYFQGDVATSATPAATTATKSATAASGSPSAKTTVNPNGSKNQKWVAGLCLAATSYETDIQKLADNVDLNNTSDTKSIKDSMVKFLTDAQTRTKQFKSDIDKLGDPDVKDGKSIQAAMSASAGTVVTVFDKAVTDVKALDTSDPSKLAASLSELGATLEASSNDIGDAFSSIDTKYDTSELTKIGQSIPECAGLLG